MSIAKHRTLQEREREKDVSKIKKLQRDYRMIHIQSKNSSVYFFKNIILDIMTSLSFDYTSGDSLISKDKKFLLPVDILTI